MIELIGGPADGKTLDTRWKSDGRHHVTAMNKTHVYVAYVRDRRPENGKYIHAGWREAEPAQDTECGGVG